MITIKVNSDITVYVFKEPDEDTYQVVSSDSEDHEGRIAYGITTIKELFDVLQEHFDVLLVINN